LFAKAIDLLGRCGLDWILVIHVTIRKSPRVVKPNHAAVEEPLKAESQIGFAFD
jgi:hypothetical protein